tara:strand:+ start:1101 stop:1274 length:174 start_codon:yes stop_codon:yes gene_type:complete
MGGAFGYTSAAQVLLVVMCAANSQDRDQGRKKEKRKTKWGRGERRTDRGKQSLAEAT